jgi:trimeric autotransporter adhesin
MKRLFLLFVFCIQCTVVAHGQIITTIAGGGTSGLGDGGAATAAQLAHPIGIAIDGAGNLYIADRDNNLIRKVTVSGVITTIAGTGLAGNTGDGGPATAAQIDHPYGVAVDFSGNVYFTGGNGSSNRVRKINTAGIITTIAGNGVGGFGGDNGPATLAELSAPTCVAVDASGNVYITDIDNNRVRKVNTSGIITTIGGTGSNINSGDGGPATNAGIYNPYGIAIDATGNIYIAEDHGYTVRKINTSGIISTIAGTGSPGYSGDNGPATAAQLDRPVGVIAGAGDYIYIADSHNNRIRKIAPDGIISTVAGTGSAGYSGDGYSPTSAELNTPAGVALDGYSNLYISDFGNSRIRYIRNTVSVTNINNTESKMTIFPNPSSGTFTVNISANEKQDISVILTDELGQTIKEIKGCTNQPIKITIDESSLSGIYILSARTNSGNSSQKVVIVK